MRIIVAHAACVPVNSVSATKASSSTLCSTSASPSPSPNGPSCSKDSSSTPSMSSSSPKLREHLFLCVHLHERTPDHHLHHPRRQGLPIARFCFALALCAANFKPTITWKRNGTAIAVGDHSSVVKRFLFVKKVQLLQGCLCIPMASVVNVLYSCSLEETVITKGHVTTANTRAHARTHTVLGLMRTSSRLVTFLLF